VHHEAQLFFRGKRSQLQQDPGGLLAVKGISLYAAEIQLGNRIVAAELLIAQIRLSTRLLDLVPAPG